MIVVGSCRALLILEVGGYQPHLLNKAQESKRQGNLLSMCLCSFWGLGLKEAFGSSTWRFKRNYDPVNSSSTSSRTNHNEDLQNV